MIALDARPPNQELAFAANPSMGFKPPPIVFRHTNRQHRLIAKTVQQGVSCQGPYQASRFWNDPSRCMDGPDNVVGRASALRAPSRAACEALHSPQRKHTKQKTDADYAEGGLQQDCPLRLRKPQKSLQPSHKPDC